METSLPRDLDWDKVWEKLDEWIQNHERIHCKGCGQIIRNWPEWEEQQEKIKEIVMEMLSATNV